MIDPWASEFCNSGMAAVLACTPEQREQAAEVAMKLQRLLKAEVQDGVVGYAALFLTIASLGKMIVEALEKQSRQ